MLNGRYGHPSVINGPKVRIGTLIHIDKRTREPVIRPIERVNRSGAPPIGPGPAA